MSIEIEIKSLGITPPKEGFIFSPIQVAFGATTIPFDLTPYIGHFISVAAWSASMHYAVGATAAEVLALNPAFTGFGPGACVPLNPGGFYHRFMLRPTDKFIAGTPSVIGTAGTLIIWVSSERDGGVTVPYP